MSKGSSLGLWTPTTVPPMMVMGLFLVPLAPWSVFRRFGKITFSSEISAAGLASKSFISASPGKAQKPVCDETPRKTAISTLAPWAENGPVQKHLGRRRAPKGALFGPLDRSDSDPFLYWFFLCSRHPSRAPFFNSSCPPRAQILPNVNYSYHETQHFQWAPGGPRGLTIKLFGCQKRLWYPEGGGPNSSIFGSKNDPTAKGKQTIFKESFFCSLPNFVLFLTSPEVRLAS